MSSYWEKRKAQRMFEYMGIAEDTAQEIAKLYRKASMYTNNQLSQIFNRYKTKFGLSEAEAYRILNTLKDKTSLDELRTVLKSDVSSDEKKEIIQLLEAPAYRARINRLQDLQNEIDVMMRNVYNQEKDFNTNHYVILASEAYYKSMYDIQKSVGFGFNFHTLSAKDFDLLLGSKWSGENFSSRIWKNTQKLAEDLKEELLVSLMTGRKEEKVAQILASKYNTGINEARRLVRTESNYVAGEMEAKSYEECGADRYIYCATLDMKTSKICRELDGKVFYLKDREQGKNYPPMHPWCRSTTIIYINDETLSKMTRIARDPETGKTYKVPANMSYEEWYEKYVNDESEVSDYLRRKSKSVASKGKVVGFDDLPEKIKSNFTEHLKSSEPNVRKLLKQEYKKIDFTVVSSKISRRNALTNVIELSEKANGSTIAHEMFHWIDNKHKITKSNDFLNLLKNDYKNISGNLEKEYFIYKLLRKYPNAFETTQKGGLRLLEEYAGISDMLNGLSEGDINLGFGHRKEYWTDIKKQREAVAQFGRIYYDNNEDVVKMFKDLFPTFDSKMEGIVKMMVSK